MRHSEQMRKQSRRDQNTVCGLWTDCRAGFQTEHSPG